MVLSILIAHPFLTSEQRSSTAAARKVLTSDRLVTSISFPIPNFCAIQISVAVANAANRRQGSNFIEVTGAVSSCRLAIRYALINGQLFADGALVTGFSVGVHYTVLAAQRPSSDINNCFAIASNIFLKGKLEG